MSKSQYARRATLDPVWAAARITELESQLAASEDARKRAEERATYAEQLCHISSAGLEQSIEREKKLQAAEQSSAQKIEEQQSQINDLLIELHKWRDGQVEAQCVHLHNTNEELQGQVAMLREWVADVVDSEFELTQRGINRRLDSGSRLLNSTSSEAYDNRKKAEGLREVADELTGTTPYYAASQELRRMADELEGEQEVAG